MLPDARRANTAPFAGLTPSLHRLRPDKGGPPARQHRERNEPPLSVQAHEPRLSVAPVPELRLPDLSPGEPIRSTRRYARLLATVGRAGLTWLAAYGFTLGSVPSML